VGFCGVIATHYVLFFDIAGTMPVTDGEFKIKNSAMFP